MSWVPRDLETLCHQDDRFSSCAPANIMFFALVTKLLSQSKDSQGHYRHKREQLKFPVWSSHFTFGTQHWPLLPPSQPSTWDNSQYSSKQNTPTTFSSPGTSAWTNSYRTFHQPTGLWYDNKDVLPWVNPLSFAISPPEKGSLHRENDEYTEDFNYQHIKDKEQEYDFIVVGAGSAGCVVANRLSEIKKWRVLLLEAGIEEPKIAEVPSFAPALQRSNIDWQYMTQPQKHACLARPNGQCYWARGKVMGGSSTINYMMYVRGNPRDYDEWEEEYGAYDWSYDDVLPYFKKSEHNTDKDVLLHAPHAHGSDGEQFVGRFPYTDKNTHPLIEAWKHLGLPEVDVNSGLQLGAMHLQMTQHAGRRVSTNKAFIRPIRKKRRNLTVRTQCHVTRILLNEHHEAYGVEYFANGKLSVVRARKEVILSAGAINSPKVLMLSGIGPKHHLKQFGIKVFSDLPVGYNLQDHVTLDGVVVALHPNVSTTDVPTETMRQELLQYIHGAKNNPFSSIGPLSVGVFLKSSYEYEHGRPDLQFTFDPVNIKDFYTDPNLAVEYNLGPLAFYTGFQLRPILLSPRSRGFIRLNKTDPVWGPPIIQPNYFTKSPDLDILVEGIEKGIQILYTKFMKYIKASLVAIPLPACKKYEFGSHSYWTCIATQYTATIFHPVGTCKMGPEGARDAVVDPELRVQGVKRLRIVDASIMPKIVRGNTNAPTIMIAEKASDIIKSHWGLD